MEPMVTIRNKRTGEMRQIAQSQLGETPTPQPQTQESGGLMKTLLPIALSIGGGILGAPLGPLGIIGGAAGGGALGGGLTGGNIGKEALFGGIGGLFPALRIGGKLAGAGARAAEEAAAQGAERATAGAGENILTRLGQTMRRNVVNPKVVPSPFAAEKEAEIASKLTSQVGGSAQAMRQKSGPMVRQIGKQIDEALAANNPGIDPNFAKRTVDSSLQNVAAYDMSDPVFKQASSVLLKKITSLKTAKDAVQYKQELSGMLGPAFTKIEKGAPLTQREEALMATWKSLDEIISGSAPHIKDLTLQQSTFYQAAPGLAAKAKQVTRIPFTGIPIPGGARGIQAGTDVLGRGIEAGGKAVGRIPIPAGLAPNVVGQVGARAMLGGMAPEEAQAAGPAIPMGKTTTRSQQPNLTDILKMAALADLGKGGKNISEIIALSNFLNPPLGAATKTQLQQIEGAQTLVDQLENVYNQASQAGELGPYGKGSLSTLTSRITGGGIAGKAGLYDNLRQGFTALIARSTGERGVLTDADAARALKLIPTANTTSEFAARQFAEIRKIFSDAQARIGGAEQWNLPMPANLGL